MGTPERSSIMEPIMKNLICILLNSNPILIVIIIALLNVTMDRIRFRYDYTLWSKIGIDRWCNPSLSWKNKHKWKPSWLFKTVLVWTTDLWHLLKFLMLNVIFVWIIVFAYGEFIWQPFLIFWLFWGVIFETIYNIKL